MRTFAKQSPTNFNIAAETESLEHVCRRVRLGGRVFADVPISGNASEGGPYAKRWASTPTLQNLRHR